MYKEDREKRRVDMICSLLIKETLMMCFMIGGRGELKTPPLAKKEDI